MAQADYVTIPIRTSIPGVCAKPSTSPAPAAHAEFIANRAQNRPHPIPLYPDPVGLDRPYHADHVSCEVAKNGPRVLEDRALAQTNSAASTFLR